MKRYLMIMLLLLPAALFAQDTAVVKRQAQAVANAIVSGNYNLVVNSMHPKVLQLAGGKAKMLQQLTTLMSQMKAQGISFQSAIIGSPGKFYKAGNEIHCLVPQTVRMKTGASSIATSANLLAISSNGGKKWSFLDLNARTIAAIPKIFPNFNPALKIPPPKQPGF